MPVVSGIKFVMRGDTSRGSASDLLQMADLGYTPAQLLLELLKKHPDVSKAVWDYVNISNTSCAYSAKNAANMPSGPNEAWLAEFLRRKTLCPQSATGPSLQGNSMDTFRAGLKLLLMLRGAAACEILVNKRLDPIGLYLRDPDDVEISQNADGTLSAAWAAGSTAVPITTPRFFYTTLNAPVNDPQGVSPILPALTVVYMQLRTLVDLAKIMKKVGWPRVDIEIDEAAVRANAPQNILADPDPQKYIAYVTAVIARIKQEYESLGPEDGFCHTSSAKFAVKSNAGGAQAFDVRSLMEVMDQQITTALKSMPSLLGRSAGKTSTFAEAEIEVFRFSCIALQKCAAEFQERVLTASLNMGGRRGYVCVKYAGIELRSPTETEQWRATKISNACAAFVAGAITFDEARRAIGGDEGTLPPLDDAEKAAAVQFMRERAGGAQKQVERTGVSTVTRDAATK